ncbi:TPA: hypothetical protein ACS70H_003472 [Providencia alcalifaciens]
MLKNSLNRIIFLILIIAISWILFSIKNLNGFASSWNWKVHQRSNDYPIEMVDQKLSGFKNGVLITGTENLIYVHTRNVDSDTYTRKLTKALKYNPVNDGSIPLLNLKISDDRGKIEATLNNLVGISDLDGYYGKPTNAPVTYLMTEKDGKLVINYRFIGDVRNQACNKKGKCLLIFNDFIHKNRATFISDNNAKNWNWLPNWRLPMPRLTYEIIGITDSNEILLTQDDKLFRSKDNGSSWKLVFNFTREKGYSHIGRAQGDWRYNSGKYVAVSGMSKDQDGELQTILLMFNLETLAVDSRVLMAGTVSDIQMRPTGEVYFILNDNTHSFYSLNKLLMKNSYSTIYESGPNHMSGLYVGKNVIIVSKGYKGISSLSMNSGQDWSRMKKVQENSDEAVLFDSWNDRLFRFPTKYEISNKNWEKQGEIIYDVATLKSRP